MVNICEKASSILYVMSLVLIHCHCISTYILLFCIALHLISFFSWSWSHPIDFSFKERRKNEFMSNIKPKCNLNVKCCTLNLNLTYLHFPPSYLWEKTHTWRRKERWKTSSRQTIFLVFSLAHVKTMRRYVNGTGLQLQTANGLKTKRKICLDHTISPSHHNHTRWKITRMSELESEPTRKINIRLCEMEMGIRGMNEGILLAV